MSYAADHTSHAAFQCVPLHRWPADGRAPYCFCIIRGMEDGVAADAGTATPRSPPPPPSPSSATSVYVDLHNHKPNEPLKLESERWDIHSISGLAALRMLFQALEALVEVTGDIPPTPPVSRPTTPNTEDTRQLALRRLSSPEAAMSIGSPEAHPHEPLAVQQYAPDASVQNAAIARRFFSKKKPSFSLEQYLLRLHEHCPHSPAVYLAAASFCHRLCVAELKVPATNRTIHRLALASIRVSEKALEDNKWRQERMAKVGGVTKKSLNHLEIALLFLLEFKLLVNEEVLASRMFLLQQAARQGVATKGKLGDQFKLKLPLRKRMALPKS